MKDLRGQTIEHFDEIKAEFGAVVVDLGTGDGRFVYKNAIENPDTLYIGVDPAPKQMEEYAKKAKKQKIGNLLFITGSFEIFPEELLGIANKLYVNLPWGTLLGAIAKPTQETVEKLASILKSGGELEIVFGYNSELEPSETSRLDLEHLTIEKIRDNIVPVYEQGDFSLLELGELHSTKKLESTWGKKISTTFDRNYFFLSFRRK